MAFTANYLCVECSVRWAETSCGSRHAELYEEHGICGYRDDRANGFGQNQRLPVQQLYGCQGVALLCHLLRCLVKNLKNGSKPLPVESPIFISNP